MLKYLVIAGVAAASVSPAFAAAPQKAPGDRQQVEAQQSRPAPKAEERRDDRRADAKPAPKASFQGHQGKAHTCDKPKGNDRPEQRPEQRGEQRPERPGTPRR